jgi:hypothetical protein
MTTLTTALSGARRLATAGLVAVCLSIGAAQPAAAAAPINSVTISGQAVLFGFANSATGVIIEVTALCEGGLGTVTVNVIQAAENNSTGLPANGQSSESVRCDGTRVKVSVVVTGTLTFNQGTAAATAVLVAPSGTAEDSQTVRITSP